MDITAKKIKERKKPKDKFYTPAKLVVSHLKYIKDYIKEGIIYEPFSGEGAYLNEFSNYFKNEVKSTEIDNGTDFFLFNEKVNYIISNPPYSKIDDVLKKSVELEPLIISYLIGLHNLTTKRIEFMNKNNYYLIKLKFLKVYDWFGMSAITLFIKDPNGKNCIDFERFVYK